MSSHYRIAAALAAFLCLSSTTRTPTICRQAVTVESGKDRAVTEGAPSGEKDPSGVLCGPSEQKNRAGLRHQEVGRSPRRTHPTQLRELSTDSSESERGGFKKCVARAGVLVPRPSGLAERQTTHSSTSGPDECKRPVHECVRDSPSLECRG